MNFLSKIDKFKKVGLFKTDEFDVTNLLMNDDLLETYLEHKSLGVTDLNKANDIYTAQSLIKMIDTMNERKSEPLQLDDEESDDDQEKVDKIKEIKQKMKQRIKENFETAYSKKDISNIQSTIYKIISDNTDSDILYYSKFCNLTNEFKTPPKETSTLKEIRSESWERLCIYSIATLSMICSALIAGTIFFNKKMQVHPSFLIAYLSIAIFGSCFNTLIHAVGTHEFVCYFGIA